MHLCILATAVGVSSIVKSTLVCKHDVWIWQICLYAVSCSLWSIWINNYCQYRIQYHSVTVFILYWTVVLVLSTPAHHTTMRLWRKPHHHCTIPLPDGGSHQQQCRSNRWCGGITKSLPPSWLVNRHRVHPHQCQIEATVVMPFT